MFLASRKQNRPKRPGRLEHRNRPVPLSLFHSVLLRKRCDLWCRVDFSCWRAIDTSKNTWVFDPHHPSMALVFTVFERHNHFRVWTLSCPIFGFAHGREVVQKVFDWQSWAVLSRESPGNHLCLPVPWQRDAGSLILGRLAPQLMWPIAVILNRTEQSLKPSLIHDPRDVSWWCLRQFHSYRRARSSRDRLFCRGWKQDSK